MQTIILPQPMSITSTASSQYVSITNTAMPPSSQYVSTAMPPSSQHVSITNIAMPPSSQYVSITSTATPPIASTAIPSSQYATVSGSPLYMRPSTASVMATSLASPAAVPTQPPVTNQMTAVIAATAIFAFAILASLSVMVILLWRRHSHRNRRGKITRKRSSIRRLLISEGEEWLRGPNVQRNSMTRLSLTLAQQEDPLQTTQGVSFMYDGVPISRQLATVRSQYSNIKKSNEFIYMLHILHSVFVN